MRDAPNLRRILPWAAVVLTGCGTAAAPVSREPSPAPAPALELRFAPDIAQRLKQLPATRLDYDRSLLDENEKRALGKLIEASREIDEIFLRQVSEENPSLRESLERLAAAGRPGAIDAAHYFALNKGPWDRLKGNEPFIGDRPKQPGAAFYPADLTKEEFERYFASDLAWMDLDSNIDVVIGPYEVYEDALFNYRAAFESFVTVQDRAESAKLAVYAGHLPDMEKNLPVGDQHKNFSRKFESPIKVVQEVFTAGDARRGVQTSAFNLPNDERVREAKGSKKVLLKNVMEAKFRLTDIPVDIAPVYVAAGEGKN